MKTLDIEQVRRFFADDTFAAAQGMVIEQADETGAVCSVLLRQDHKNALGMAQGGLVYTLADFTFAVAAYCRSPGTVTLSGEMHYLRSPRSGKLSAQAVLRGGGKTVCVYEVTVRDEQGTEVALMTATGYSRPAR